MEMLLSGTKRTKGSVVAGQRGVVGLHAMLLARPGACPMARMQQHLLTAAFTTPQPLWPLQPL